MPIVLIKILIALIADQILGEPRKGHPLVAFGNHANRLEARYNNGSEQQRLRSGVIAWCIAVLPWVALAAVAHLSPLGFWFDCILLYLAIGRKSLFEHSERVWNALQGSDLQQARHHTGMIVSRDTTTLDATGCTRATIESVLENANDSIVGALFWFALLGGPGVVLYRLANTLDAMWGYRTERFNAFGRAAARIDDVLNFLPARLCAFAYAIAGDFPRAMDSWRSEARLLKSPNGGPVMTAGAGALNLQLGGPAVYHGTLMEKPFFGGEQVPVADDIARANRLVDRALVVVVLIIAGAAWLA